MSPLFHLTRRPSFSLRPRVRFPFLRGQAPGAAAKHIRRARELALQSLIEARRSVHALRPQALEKTSFPDALKTIITNTTAGTSLQSDFQLKGEPRKLHSSAEENLLHIGQEALANALARELSLATGTSGLTLAD